MSACAAFGPDGPAGIAEALRTVDCLSADATASAFGRLFGAQAVLGTGLTLILTLYVGLMAVNLLTGRSTLGISALTPRMLALGMVLTFVTSWVAYQGVVWNLLVGVPDQIASLLLSMRGSATMAFADRLDMLFGAVASAAEAAQAASAGATKDQMFSPADVLWLGAFLLLLGTVGVLLVARIALAALLALGPVFIVLALFRGTHGLFQGWLKAAVMFAIIPLFVVLIGGGALAMLAPLVTGLELAGGELTMRMAVTIFLAAAVYCVLMAMVMKVATTIVSGWQLPFASEARPAASSPAPHGSQPSNVLRIASDAARPQPAPLAQDRVRAITAGLAAPMQGGEAQAATISRIPRIEPLALVHGAPPSVQRDGDPRSRTRILTYRENGK
jgi:type IV secretion system protein VirB6